MFIADLGYDEIEEWRDISGYPNYMISNLGRVWNAKFDRFLKPAIIHGYEYVDLCTNGERKQFQIHRLVADAFIQYRIDAYNVNHDDGDKCYNYVDNLEWCTQSENVQHAYDTGLRLPPHMKAVRIIETNEMFQSISECARAINGNRENIRSCLFGRRKRHLGYTFEYV